MERLTDKIYAWARRKRLDRLVKRWGQIRQCPWCRQFVEEGAKHNMREAEHCAAFDTFTCGTCGGESHWEFAPAPIPRGLGNGPIPEQWALNADKQKLYPLRHRAQEGKTDG